MSSTVGNEQGHGDVVTDPRAPERLHHRIVIVGGGTAGISVAARLARALKSPDIALIEPSEKHYYQPLWTLVGGGVYDRSVTERREKDLIPKGVTWIRERAATFCPEDNHLRLSDGRIVSYDYLVVAAGIQIDWGKVKGLAGNVGKDGLCSNYSYDTVASTWEAIRGFRGGTAIFTQPSTPIKCGGAPQKIMYLAADYFARHGLADKSQILFASGTGGIFSVKEYAATLNKVIARRHIETLYKHDLVEVRPQTREAVFKNLETGAEVTRHYDIMHVTPFMSAPDFLKASPLANAAGWVDVDKYTLQHVRFPNLFGLGDSSGLPTSKTGAAIRKQAPVVVRNLLSVMEGRAPAAKYDGYTSCPLVTGYGKLVMAEFDYDLKPKETFPIDQTKERWSMYMVKKHLLPLMYWHGMLRGRM